MSLGPYEKQSTEDPRLDSPPIRGLNPSAVWESLRGIIPVHDHPGLLLFIRESDNKDKSFLSRS